MAGPARPPARLLLTIDVGNRQTSLAAWPLRPLADEGPEPRAHWLVGTHPGQTADEHRLILGQLLTEAGLQAAEVGAVAVACVVPGIARALGGACRTLFGTEALFVGPGLRSGMPIRTENPPELGPDRLANAVAALAGYGAPVIVLDFATALTLDLVDGEGRYQGTYIAPGIEVAAAALAERTARLGPVVLGAPRRAIGADTESGLRSGLVYGYVGLIEGLLEAAQDALDGRAAVVATGDLAAAEPLLAELAVRPQADPWLTARGLRLLHHRNQPDPA